jgi:NAD(P)H-hydrate epimerase
MKVITVAQMRFLEKQAIEAGKTELMMIDEVATGIADAIARYFPRELYCYHTFYFFCGKGNNGADGRASAKILAGKGYLVEVIDASQFSYETFSLTEKHVLIDAMLGIGARPGICGSYEAWIKDCFLKAKGKIVAIDVPTGITGDDGCLDPCAVRADLTICCGFPKQGLFHDELLNYAGKIVVAPLSFPKSAVAKIPSNIEWIDEDWVRERVFVPEFTAHKHARGWVHLIAGNVGTIGASRLMALGSLASGVGLVTLWVRQEIYSIVAASVAPEVMVRSIASVDDMVSEIRKKADAVGIGPGAGIDRMTKEIVDTFIMEDSIPCLFDADALAIIGDESWVDRLSVTALVTPHWGEMLRLLREDDLTRLKASEIFCNCSQACLLLKGPNTLVRQQGDSIAYSYNSSGNQGLARGGTGDILAGLISGLMAQRYPLSTAARIGAWIHGAAADELSIENGYWGWSLEQLISGIRRHWRLLL